MGIPMGIPTGFLWEWNGNGNGNSIPTATVIERKVFKGIESSKMCNFHNISNCNSNKIVLIIYEPRDLCFSNDEEYGSNKDVCLFSAVCHYSIWVPLLACSGILLFFLTYAIISLVFIHRYLT